MRDYVGVVIRNKKSKFKLLFLNFCYSESIAKELFEIGVAEHIICINENMEVEDKIARAFAVTFYRKFSYAENNSLC